MSRTSGYSSGSPGEPRRSPLTIGCPRNWMNMWSYGFTMLAPPNSCWRTEAFVRGWCLKNGFLVGFFGHPKGLMNQKKSWLLAGFSGKTSHTVDRVKLKICFFVILLEKVNGKSNIFFWMSLTDANRHVQHILHTMTARGSLHIMKCNSFVGAACQDEQNALQKTLNSFWTVCAQIFCYVLQGRPPRGSSWEFLWAQTTTSTCWFYVTPELVTDLNRLNT